jgi:hypothetical protein
VRVELAVAGVCHRVDTLAVEERELAVEVRRE